MLDFVTFSARSTKRDKIEILPTFIVKKSNDLMIRGGDFYAIWVEERGLWSTDEQDALQLIDRELDAYAEKNRDRFDGNVKVLHMWDASSGMIDAWHKYCQRQLRDNFHMLDETIIFSNTKTGKKDYASHILSYPLEQGPVDAWDELLSTLYAPEERHKIEWAIGAIVSGASKKLQKFMVLYGAMGTGKSTVLNIMEKLFDGYWSTIDSKALGSLGNAFALEAFRTNPLVGIEHDGDLSRIEDNTRLNSLVSHESIRVNEKFKATYESRFKCFMILGTNKPVKITDAKSGLLRRLIDVSPTGNKIPTRRYNALIKQIDFELGAIAHHCLSVFQEDPGFYDNYVPLAMMGATNDFYNFVEDSYIVFKREDGVTLKAAWEMYKTYNEEAKVPFPLTYMRFREELKNYFWSFEDRPILEDGSRPRKYYSGFRTDKFESNRKEAKDEPNVDLRPVITFEEDRLSAADAAYADCPAQYANAEGTPFEKWERVTTCLSDLDTSKLHYVKLPENHIVIDFDIPGDDGKKSFERNLAEASKWPPTYAELSKSGAGIHLHYIYTGDATKLSRIYSDHIEVKVSVGNSSLRRKLTRCNDLPIAEISSGLPLKGEKKVVNDSVVKNEKSLRRTIEKCLKKEYHGGFTAPNVQLIAKQLEDAYQSGMTYDVTDLRPAVLALAANSTNQAETCIKLVNKMQFKSEEQAEGARNDDQQLVFYDVEVFPNLFLVNWKFQGEGRPVTRMINPSSREIEDLIKFRLVGFNCRRYDNHILYARLMGYTNEQLYNLSQRIIGTDKKAAKSSNCFFGEAYNLSYTDVYDFCSTKQGLKKWEIELGIHHQELGLPWDQPVPEELWPKVAEYCDNDVIATEAVFNARKADFLAREILADVAGMTVNDTTNTLSARIIFGKNRTPQDQFNYRDMGEMTPDVAPMTVTKDMVMFTGFGDEHYSVFDGKGRPVFPGYRYGIGGDLLKPDDPRYKAHAKTMISLYRDEIVGEGGYVYAEPGMYGNVALLDVASMHPSSVIAEQLFGKEYTKRFEEIKEARVAIKHKDFDKARKMLNGVLAKYLNDESVAGDLSQALKIVINSVYGLTSASFENPFRDKRNRDNIVAKRGALFMVNLKHEVQERGFTVAHIKTDSIKIPDATPEIIQFVMDYGKQYGYTFEHEATYDRMCLVNNAVYIARYATAEKCQQLYGYVPGDNKKHPFDWTPTGTQFAVPYVFKRLFSHEEITFDDMCETKSVTTGTMYLDMNEKLPDVSSLERDRDKALEDLRKIASGKYKGTATEEELRQRIEELEPQIAEGHNYVFVGRVGQFCPMKSDQNGGILLRETEDKKTGEKGYAAVAGTTGYRWTESEIVRTLERQDGVDRSYYDNLVNEAVETISKYGDFEWFVSDEQYMAKLSNEDDRPPWEAPDVPWDNSTPFDVR